MYPSDSTFVETMCARYGKIDLMKYHNERLNRTMSELFGCNELIDLNRCVNPDVCGEYIKVRVIYGKDGIKEITYAPYSPKLIRSLKLITCNEIEYSYKSTDRSMLSLLASRKGSCDEVLIVKNGLVTDTSYTNIAAYLDGRWLTPRTPLLKGTRRACLLEKGIITEADIRADEITPDTDIMLFNGMMDFGMISAHITK